MKTRYRKKEIDAADHGKKLWRESGVTLVELMIALVIGMIITISVYATYISQERSFTAQDAVVELNATSKVALDMIVNDIREAGFGIPDNVSAVQRTSGCYGINGYTEKIKFEDSDKSEDTITFVGAYRLAGYLKYAVGSGDTQITLSYYQDNLDTEDRSYISIGGMSFALVSAAENSKFTLKEPIIGSHSAGVPVYLIENVTYRVDKGRLQRVRRLSGTNCTTRTDVDIIAENIEDLQFEMIDTDGDKVADRIRVNILARASRQDQDFQGQGNPPAKIANREHAAASDGYRRRWWQMEVVRRNPI